MEEKTLVVIPTFNERENIRDLIGKILSQPLALDILVVDDCSQDGTSDVVDQISSQFPQVSVMHRLGKNGRGNAVKSGFDYAFENFYDFVIEMDADLSHNPDDIPLFMNTISDYDMVVGSRYVQGGKAIYNSTFRFWMSRISNFFNSLILGMKYMDVTCDFRCYKLSSLKHFNLDEISSPGFVFGVELLYKLGLNGFSIKEIPITFTERTRGKSKTDWRVIIKYPIQVLRMKRGVSKK